MSLIPRWYNRLPAKFRKEVETFDLEKFFKEMESGLLTGVIDYKSGLTVFRDEKNIYIKADVPGLTANDVDVSIDNEGILWIKGKRQEEKKGKKFYKKSQQSFCYCIPVKGQIDETKEIKATCKDGVMSLILPRKKEKQAAAKKIKVKEKK